MKMTAKQRERLVRILEVLKTEGCITAYRLEGEWESILPGWVVGGVERVFEEVLDNPRPFGLRKSDRGWLVLLLPKERQLELAEAMLTLCKASVRRMAQVASNSSISR